MDINKDDGTDGSEELTNGANGTDSHNEDVVDCQRPALIRCRNESCVESNVQSEDGLLVCINCGQLFNKSQIQLRNDPTQEYTLNCRPDETKSYVANNRHFPNRFPTAPKTNSKELDLLVANLSLSVQVREQALTIYKDMIGGVFRCATYPTKKILSALCIYITLVNEGTPVTIGHICNTIGCNTSEFNKVYNQVHKEFPQHRPEQMPIETLVPVILSEAKMDAKEKKQLEEKVLKILELERECWLIEGRTPCHIIYAAAFLAWKSIKPYDRRKHKLTDFCRLVGIDYKHTTSERVTELFNALKKLATKIPAKSKVCLTKTNIGSYLDQILEYQSSLVFDLNQQMKRLQKSNGLVGNCSTNGDADDPSDKCPDWSSTFKRKSAQSHTNFDRNSSQSTADLTISDEEFSDSEINSYLRDDKELKFIKKLRKFQTLIDNEPENK